MLLRHQLLPFWQQCRTSFSWNFVLWTKSKQIEYVQFEIPFDIVAKNGNNVEASFDFAEKVARLVAIVNIASTLLLVRTGLKTSGQKFWRKATSHVVPLNDPFCCVHRSKDSQMLFSGPENPQSCHFRGRIWSPRLNTWFLRSTRSRNGRGWGAVRATQALK